MRDNKFSFHVTSALAIRYSGDTILASATRPLSSRLDYLYRFQPVLGLKEQKNATQIKQRFQPYSGLLLLYKQSMSNNIKKSRLSALPPYSENTNREHSIIDAELPGNNRYSLQILKMYLVLTHANIHEGCSIALCMSNSMVTLCN